jgi:hypothetical protein
MKGKFSDESEPLTEAGQRKDVREWFKEYCADKTPEQIEQFLQVGLLGFAAMLMVFQVRLILVHRSKERRTIAARTSRECATRLR